MKSSWALRYPLRTAKRDQTIRMLSLIRVFTRHTDQIVCLSWTGSVVIFVYFVAVSRWIEKKVSVMTYYHKTSPWITVSFLTGGKVFGLLRLLECLLWLMLYTNTLIYNSHCFYKRTTNVLISLCEGLGLLFFFFFFSNCNFATVHNFVQRCVVYVASH